MTSFVLNRYVGPEFEKERYEQVDKIAQWLYEVDNAPDKSHFGNKLKRFWKGTRIHSVFEKVVSQSKSFLSRLASRLTPDSTPPVSDHSGNKASVDTTGNANVSRENTVSPVYSRTVTSCTLTYSSLEENALGNPAKSAASVSKPENCAAINHPTTEDSTSRSESATERTFSAFRYKEKEHDKQRDFPEIKIEVVSTRAKWLEPLLSGERNWQEKVNQSRSDTESDGESAFDDSPRRFKHRLPKEEPKPWVEPGTVAKGAMWLHPVLSGEKRTKRGDSNQERLASPRRVSHGMFR